MSSALSESVPRPAKKARTESYGDTCSQNERPPAFLLDAFPAELMDNVLRFFSILPKTQDWVPHTPLESIIELYGELGKLMKTRFNALCKKRREGAMLWPKYLEVTVPIF